MKQPKVIAWRGGRLNRTTAIPAASNEQKGAAGAAMGVILPALVFLTFRVAAVLADV